MKSYRTPLARAQGLGPARQGRQDWWWQRVTAVALIPLGLWFAFSVVRLPSAGHEDIVAWIKAPWNSLMLLFFIPAIFYHTVLGLQTVIEDYVHSTWLKLSALLGVKLFFTFLALTASYAILRIAFTGGT